ncbi:MAG: hypothetical protein RR842_13115, partial [Gordonibacter sp.]|uniref:hypothetical protein n=1 Tax=Gordonibacter sp. TaxID=1968902 RepID=UPI002FC68473
MDVDVSKGSWQSRTTTRRPNTVTALVALTAFLLFGLNNTEMAALPTYTMSLGAGPFVASLQNSLFVLSTVMRVPAPDRVILDAGLKSTTAECGPPAVFNADGLTYASINDEHGVVRVAPGAQAPALGDVLRLVPSHVDP